MSRAYKRRPFVLLSFAAGLLVGVSLMKIAIVFARGTDVQSRESVQQLLSDQRLDDSEAVALIFRQGVDALPTLVSALRDGRSLDRASRALAYSGGPEQRRTLRDLIAVEKDQGQKSLVSSLLAGALVQPVSADDWSFLQACLAEYNNSDKALESFTAALALGVNGSPQALHMLRTVVASADQSGVVDNDTVEEARKAIDWITRRSHSSQATPSVGVGTDSEQIRRIILKDVFYAEGEAEHLSIDEVVFSTDEVRALVSVEIYRSPANARGFDLVLERRSSRWSIIGTWLSWVA